MFELYIDGIRVESRNYNLLINGVTFKSKSQFILDGETPSEEIVMWAGVDADGGPVNGTQIKTVAGGPVNGTQIKTRDADGGPVNGTQIKGVVVVDVSNSIRFEGSSIRSIVVSSGNESVNNFKIIIN